MSTGGEGNGWAEGVGGMVGWRKGVEGVCVGGVYNIAAKIHDSLSENLAD